MAISKRLRFEILRRDNHKCYYCGRTPPTVQLTVDHVVPESLGGTDDPKNLVAACGDCNGGKSSVPPDAPLVAAVADDAVRMARAIAITAQERAAMRSAKAEQHDQFLVRWKDWTYEHNSERRTIALPHSWPRSVDQFLDAGLEMDDLFELIDVAMRARTTDEWKYFCGCCWRRVREIQERAAEIVRQPIPVAEVQSAPDLPSQNMIQTKWTKEERWAFVKGACAELNLAAADIECQHGQECADWLCMFQTLSHGLGYQQARSEVLGVLSELERIGKVEC